MENFNKDFERKISSIAVHDAIVLQVYASILKVKWFILHLAHF